MLLGLAASCGGPEASRPPVSELQRQLGLDKLPADFEIIGWAAGKNTAGETWVIRTRDPLPMPDRRSLRKAPISASVVIAACGMAGIDVTEVGKLRSESGTLTEWSAPQSTIRVRTATTERGHIQIIEFLSRQE